MLMPMTWTRTVERERGKVQVARGGRGGLWPRRRHTTRELCGQYDGLMRLLAQRAMMMMGMETLELDMAP